MPERILQAYLDESSTVSVPPLLGDLMNEWQKERNVILNEAIRVLFLKRYASPDFVGNPASLMSDKQDT